MTGTLDRSGQLTLVAGAGTGHAARNDLSTLGQVAAQTLGVFIIDHLDLIGTESTNLFSSTHRSSSCAFSIALIVSHGFMNIPDAIEEELPFKC